MKLITSFLFLLFSIISTSQIKLDITLTPQENFELNCHPMLQYGIFIPRNIDECMLVLLHYNESKICKFQELSESDAESIGFGEYEAKIRNNWDLKISSVLARYFYRHSVYDPETMISIVLITFHRYLSTNKFEELAIIAEMKNKYRKEEKEALKNLIKLGKFRYQKHKKNKKESKKGKKKGFEARK